MANPEAKVQALLRQHRFKLVRQHKHLVYQNPEGRVYVMAATPSDYRAVHRQLTSLKRCLASPPVPMVLAISDFEREEAAALIAAAPRATAGVSSGKHHRSSGTGYKYVEKILTAEELAERERLAEVARAAAARRVERREERRARKLAQRAEKAAQKEQAEQEFQTHCSAFLKDVRWSVEYADTRFLKTCRIVQESRMWSTDPFYEFAVSDEDKVNEKAVKEHIEIFVTDALSEDPTTTLGELDAFHAKLLGEITPAVEASSARVEKVMRFVEKRLRQDPDALSLLWDVYEEKTRDWSRFNFSDYGYLCVLHGLYEELRELILGLLNPGESPNQLAAVFCNGGDDDGRPEFRVLVVGEGQTDVLGNPMRGIPADDEEETEQEDEDVEEVAEEILASVRSEAA